MIRTIDETIPFSRRHPNETIRMIIRHDSGYLKDLFLKDTRLVFSEECIEEICRLTKGHKDNWEKPTFESKSVFVNLKPYATPYLFDFNDDSLLELNKQRLSNEFSK